MDTHPGNDIALDSGTLIGKHLVVVAYDSVGPRMAGPAIRSWELAQAAARAGAEVTFLTRTPIERAHQNVNVEMATDNRTVNDLVENADAILLQGLAMRHFPSLQSSKAVRIVDLYDPWVLENLELYANRSQSDTQSLLLADAAAQKELIDAGDFFICASDRQRDYWLGMLTAQGRLVPSVHADCRTLRSLIDVVPYGCPSSPPTPDPDQGLRGTLCIDDDTFVVLWSGGAWEWFDPLTVLDAVEKAHATCPNIALVFLGLSLAGQPNMPVATSIMDRIESSSVLKSIVKLGDWVAYDERGAWLLDSDVAVVATEEGIESRLAFRSRMLDHFWAGLPTISTPGDVLTDLIASSGAGWETPYGDSDQLATLLTELASDTNRVSEARLRAQQLSSSFEWDHCVTPILRVLDDPARWQELRRLRPTNPFAVGRQKTRFRRPLPPGFHSRGFIIDSLKLSPLYPAIRRARRSNLGVAIWGDPS